MARTSRLKVAGAIAVDTDAASVPVLASGGIVPPLPDVVVESGPLGATIDESVAEQPKARAKKAEPVASEPRPATVAEMMAQSLRNHQEYTDRAAAIAELEKQLKNL